jgi:hypothetical protein
MELHETLHIRCFTFRKYEAKLTHQPRFFFFNHKIRVGGLNKNTFIGYFPNYKNNTCPLKSFPPKDEKR